MAGTAFVMLPGKLYCTADNPNVSPAPQFYVTFGVPPTTANGFAVVQALRHHYTTAQDGAGHTLKVDFTENEKVIQISIPMEIMTMAMPEIIPEERGLRLIWQNVHSTTLYCLHPGIWFTTHDGKIAMIQIDNPSFLTR